MLVQCQLMPVQWLILPHENSDSKGGGGGAYNLLPFWWLKFVVYHPLELLPLELWRYLLVY